MCPDFIYIIYSIYHIYYIYYILYSTCISPIQSSEQRNVTRLPLRRSPEAFPQPRAAGGVCARMQQSVPQICQNVTNSTNIQQNIYHSILFLLVFFSLLYNKQPLKQIGNISPTACKPKSTREQFQCQRQIIFTSSAACPLDRQCPVSNANFCWSVTLLNQTALVPKNATKKG